MKHLLPLLLVCCGCLKIDWENQGPVVPDPNPPHVVVDRQFKVLIVEETADRPKLPGSQSNIFTSVTFRHYLQDHCCKLDDGSPAFRIVDVDQIDKLPSEFRETAKLDRGKLPWLWATDGTDGISQPLPKSVDEAIEVLKPFAEGKE